VRRRVIEGRTFLWLVGVEVRQGRAFVRLRVRARQEVLREQRQGWPPAADAIRHDLRGFYDGGRDEGVLHCLGVPARRQRRVRAEIRIPASKGDGIPRQ
jgi:hypothetical protein